MPRPPPPAPRHLLQFIVDSAEEAAGLIRERLGPAAPRAVGPHRAGRGLRAGCGRRPALEVMAQIDAPAAPAEAGPGPGGRAAPAPPRPRPRRPPRAAPPRPPAARSRPCCGARDFRRSPSAGCRPRPLAGAGRARPCTGPWSRSAGTSSREAEQRGRRAPLDPGGLPRRPPASGRTTALCKWLGARGLSPRPRSGHVVTVEFDRPNPPGALPVFCEALGVPVAHFPAATQPAVPGGFVYFDLPGFSPARSRRKRRASPISWTASRSRERVLVLNAAYDHATLRAAYAAGRELGATHLVFTHLDEVPQWGRLWDYLLDGALEPLFLGTGPSLTGDCEEDVFGALVRRTLRRPRPERNLPTTAMQVDALPSPAAHEIRLSARWGRRLHRRDRHRPVFGRDARPHPPRRRHRLPGRRAPASAGSGRVLPARHSAKRTSPATRRDARRRASAAPHAPSPTMPDLSLTPPTPNYSAHELLLMKRRTAAPIPPPRPPPGAPTKVSTERCR